jgi:hypothetical protein
MLQWKEINNQAFGDNSSLQQQQQQQQQLHVRGIYVLAACNPEGPNLPTTIRTSPEVVAAVVTEREREREREREDCAVGAFCG